MYETFKNRIVTLTQRIPVFISSFEGFGGHAMVVDHRDEPGSHFKVRMLNNSQPDFWAHDFEIVEDYSSFSHALQQASS